MNEVEEMLEDQWNINTMKEHRSSDTDTVFVVIYLSNYDNAKTMGFYTF